MRFLLDTNILLRIDNPASPATMAVGRELANGLFPVIVPQVLTEYWAVATRPLEANGLGLTTNRTSAEIESFKQRFQFGKLTAPLSGSTEISLAFVHKCKLCNYPTRPVEQDPILGFKSRDIGV